MSFGTPGQKSEMLLGYPGAMLLLLIFQNLLPRKTKVSSFEFVKMASILVAPHSSPGLERDNRRGKYTMRNTIANIKNIRTDMYLLKKSKESF